MPFESVTPTLPAGAGRIMDWIFPDPFSHDANIPVQMRSRNSQGDASVGAGEVVAVSGGGSVTWGVLNGVDCGGFNCGAGGQCSIFRFPNAGFFHVKTSKNNILPAVDDLSAKRHITTMAMQSPPNAGLDYGVEYTRRASTRILADGNDGWGILLIDAVTARFLARGPNGLVSQDFAVNDTTKLHTYEFRIVDATPTTEAQLQLLIDGNVQALAAASTNWGPGTNLPPSSNVGGIVGWQCIITPVAGNANRLNVYQQRLIQAPSLLMTL